MKIIKNNNIPKYVQLKDILKDKILRQNPGEKFDTEKELMERYSLSYSTVSMAMKELEREGFIERIQRKGSFIVDKKSEVNINLLNNYKEVDDVFDILKSNSYNYKLNFKKAPLEFFDRNTKDLWLNSNFDIIELDNIYTYYEHMYNGVLSPTNELFEKNNINIFKYFNQTVIENYSKNGIFYSVPLFLAPVVLIYNKNIFDNLDLPYPDESLDWESFITLNKMIKKLSLNTIYPFFMNMNFNRILPLMWQNDGYFINEKHNEYNFNNLSVIETIRYLIEILELNDYIPKKIDFNFTKYAHYLFENDKLGMISSQSFYVNELIRKNKNIGVTYLPKGKKRSTLLLVKSFGIKSNSNNIQKSNDFIIDILKDNIQNYIYNSTYHIPVNKNLQIINKNFDKNKEVIYKSLSHARVPAIDKFGIINTVFTQAVNSILLGNDIFNELEKCDKQINFMIKNM